MASSQSPSNSSGGAGDAAVSLIGQTFLSAAATAARVAANATSAETDRMPWTCLTIEPEWNESFLKLAKFHEQNKHLNVPKDDASPLSRWVQEQHVEYTRFVALLEGESTDQASTTMNEEKLRRLRRLGFIFQRQKILPPTLEESVEAELALLQPPSTSTSTTSPQEARWRQHVELLQKFKLKYQHCDVPANDEGLAPEDAEFKGLGPWLKETLQAVKKQQEQQNETHTIPPGNAPANTPANTPAKTPANAPAAVTTTPIATAAATTQSENDSVFLTTERIQTLVDLGVDFKKKKLKLPAHQPPRGTGKKRKAGSSGAVGDGEPEPAKKPKARRLPSSSTKRERKAEEREAERELQWEGMLNSMNIFIKQNGHANIPSNAPEYSSLRTWVKVQRQEYKKLQDGQPSKLTAIKLQRLTDIKFVFVHHRRLKFDERFQQWLDYRKQHNGKDPPRYDGEGLGKWITMIRDKRRLLDAGKTTNLTQEQVDRLTENGFKWSCVIKRPENRSAVKSWEERFVELQAYLKEKGDTIVPQKLPGLGAFVASQRSQYKRFLKGKKSAMTPEKIRKLNSIGFCWEVMPRKNGILPTSQVSRQAARLKRGSKDDSSSDDDDEDDGDGDEQQRQQYGQSAHAPVAHSDYPAQQQQQPHPIPEYGYAPLVRGFESKYRCQY